jgi:hypothetical protein
VVLEETRALYRWTVDKGFHAQKDPEVCWVPEQRQRHFGAESSEYVNTWLPGEYAETMYLLQHRRGGNTTRNTFPIPMTSLERTARAILLFVLRL